MKGSSFGYLFREGLRGIYANRMMSAASAGVMVACLLLGGIAFLASININSIIGSVEDQNEVVVFLSGDVSEADIKAVELAINEVGNIFDLRYISKEDALKSELEKLGEASALFEGLQGDENPLPDSFRVRVENLDGIESTVRALSAIEGVEQVNAPFDVVRTLSDIKSAVYMVGTGVIALLIAVSVIITSNTVRVAVFSRRREINIMKFVGATDWFIRLPFVIEGMFLGLISALLSFFILWGGYEWLSNWMRSSPEAWVQVVSGGMVGFGEAGLTLFASFILAGTLIGASGSLFFVSRYLKV